MSVIGQLRDSLANALGMRVHRAPLGPVVKMACFSDNRHAVTFELSADGVRNLRRMCDAALREIDPDGGRLPDTAGWVVGVDMASEDEPRG